MSIQKQVASDGRGGLRVEGGRYQRHRLGTGPLGDFTVGSPRTGAGLAELSARRVEGRRGRLLGSRGASFPGNERFLLRLAGKVYYQNNYKYNI